MAAPSTTRVLLRACLERGLSVRFDQTTNEHTLGSLLRAHERLNASTREQSWTPVVVSSSRPSSAYKLDGYTQIVPGDCHAILVTRSGVVVTVGEGDWSAFETGQVDPVVVDLGAWPAGSITSIACGATHELFVSLSGEVRVSGSNVNGKLLLGRNDETVPATQPRLLASLEGVVGRVKQVAVGLHHSLFLTVNGQVYSCGSDQQGQLGLGEGCEWLSKAKRVSFRGESNTSYVRRVFARCLVSGFIVAQTRGGERLYMCGENSQAALGVGDVAQRNLPTLVRFPAREDRRSSLDFVDAATSGSHTLVLCADGRLFSFGSNSRGRCAQGDHDMTHENVTTRPRLALFAPSNDALDDTHLCRVRVGPQRSIVITDAGGVFGCGSNRCGELGTLPHDNADDPYYGTLHRLTLVPSPSGERVVDVVCADSTTYTLLSSGHCMAFGLNTFGQRGLADRLSVNTPPNVLTSVWHAAPWSRRAFLSSYPLSFRLALRFSVITWQCSRCAGRDGRQHVWRRAGVGYLPLRILICVFSMASLPWSVWVGE